MLNRTVHIPALGQDLLNGSRIGICIHIALKLGFWLATVKTCGIFLAFLWLISSAFCVDSGQWCSLMQKCLILT